MELILGYKHKENLILQLKSSNFEVYIDQEQQGFFQKQHGQDD